MNYTLTFDISYMPVPKADEEESADITYEGVTFEKLNVKETMKLSCEFCILWFVVWLHRNMQYTNDLYNVHDA